MYMNIVNRICPKSAGLCVWMRLPRVQVSLHTCKKSLLWTIQSSVKALHLKPDLMLEQDAADMITREIKPVAVVPCREVGCQLNIQMKKLI